MKGKKGLTLKQKRFTAEYIKTGNGTQAARKAYGVSDKVASVMAVENLGKPSIKAAVESAAQKLGINTEYVLGNFKEMLEFGKKKVIKAKQIGGEVFHEEEMIDGQLAFKNNEALAKHLSLFADKEVNNTQINFYQNASDMMSDNVQKLIDVTNTVKKKGIEEII